MKVNPAKIIIDLLFLAKEFFKDGNKSIYSLLKDSGYFSCYNQISVGDIYSGIINSGSSNIIIDTWLRWSEQKRVDSGWFVCRHDNGFEVGYILKGKTNHNEVYMDAAEAFSVFIKNEIEDIRQIG